MDDKGKFLFMDGGNSDHPTRVWSWVSVVLVFIQYSIITISLWRDWRLRTQFYWLWYEPPTFPFFWFALYSTLIILVIIYTLALTKAIRKCEIRVYEQGIEVYGLKWWHFWPKLHYFELNYSDIVAVKKVRFGVLHIRSTKGRYRLTIQDPEYCVKKILSNMAPLDK